MRRARERRSVLPVAYIAAAMLAAVVILPSALRPPPDPANSSGALNPNAPPNQNPNQLLESLQEAGGGGAGAGAGGTTTTVPNQKVVSGPTATTLPPAVASLGYCYGNPPRQIPSVYAGPCVGAWHGDNGGSTSLNVFPNEIRIGVDNGGPDAGRVPDPSSNTAGTDSATIFWQVMEQYFNTHFQLYGRKVVFYGLGDANDSTASKAASDAATYAQQNQLFGIISAVVGVCKDFVRYGLVSICDPMSDAEYNQYRPGMFSLYTDLSVMFQFGAEFACKSLLGRVARYGGPDVNGKPRKFGFFGIDDTVKGGMPGSVFATDFSSQCGGQVETATMTSAVDASGAAAAITRFKADGVTTIIFSNQGENVLLGMNQATSLGYNPEWVMLGEYADDTNTIGALFPPQQSQHLFGLTPLEWSRPPPQTECAQAFHSVDPGANPSASTCILAWVDLVLLFDGLQGAGPHLTPATFQQGLFGLGHRFGDPVWKIGGGFGPGSYAYQDAMAEIWWSSSAVDPNTGAPGAYVWINGGKKYEMGQLPTGDAGFFSSGSAQAPGG